MFDPSPLLHLGLGGPEILKAEGHIFITVYKTKDVQQVAN